MERKSIAIAAGAIAGLPLAWYLVARNEFRNHTLEKLCGDKYRGVYVLAALISLFSCGRNVAFRHAMRQNAAHKALPMLRAALTDAHLAKTLKIAGTTCIGVGTTLVVSSFLRLGVTGTYLGDYFGILMKERVTSFPFNVLENPMYVGATLNFFGAAALESSGVGALRTGWVALMYAVSTKWFENPFIAQIYSCTSADAAEAVEGEAGDASAVVEVEVGVREAAAAVGVEAEACAATETAAVEKGPTPRKKVAVPAKKNVPPKALASAGLSKSAIRAR